jgi:hypothetical protein
MAAEVAPPELARLLDFAERPRAHDWSLRAALCRYAQPQPARVSEVLDLVRRIEFALSPYVKTIERDADDPFVAGLLAAIVEVDRMGDVLAEWAVDRVPDRPDAAVDTATTEIARRLEELGVPHEDQSARRGRRPSGGT